MNTGASWLGIDIGTSSVKSLLIDRNQQTIASESAALHVDRPHRDWSEQDPMHWWQAVIDTIDSLADSHSSQLKNLRGIGLAGQMHGATLLDKNQQVLRPCMLWNDARSVAQCEYLERRADFRGITGNLLMPGFTAAKVQWVRDNEPDVFDRIDKVLLPKDYIRWQLSGEFCSDMSDSAGTLWLDVAGRCWSDQLLACTGLDRGQMPELFEGSDVSATLRPELVDRWQLTHAPVIAAGAGDNAAAACGVGAVSSGSGFLSLGSSGVLFSAGETFSPNTKQAVHTFCHAVPGRWHQMGVVLSATDSLNWLSTITSTPVPQMLNGLLATPPTDDADVIFLPYLAGERTPHNDANASGTFTGLSHTSDIKTLTRAVLEGVAYALVDCLDALRAAGSTTDSVFAVGGGARSSAWLQMISDATGLELLVPGDGDMGAAFGAARLAICASEGAGPVEVCTTPEIKNVISPIAAHHGYHERALARYRAMYPAQKTARSASLN